ncbi:MAG: acyltransferase [Hyphomicrobiaceae bacterium]
MAFNQSPATVLADIMAPDRNSFGVIRLAMALAVLVSHSFYFVTANPLSEPLVAITGHSLGEHAVQVFFFLSGILVTQSILKSASVADFAAARALRIFPGLAVCVLATALLLGPIVSSLSPAAYFADGRLIQYVTKTLFLTTGAAPLPGTFLEVPAAGLVNMSLWTLKYEVLCYVALAVAAAAGAFVPRYRGWTIGALAIIVFSVFLKSPSAAHDYTQLDNIRYFTLYFSTGVLACLVKDRLVIDVRILACLAALFAAAIGTRCAELTCALFLGYATLCVARINFGPLRRWTQSTDLSFGVYIYAAPIQQTLLSTFPNLSPLELTGLAAVLALIAAYVSWERVEKRSLRARRPLVAALHASVRRSPRVAVAARVVQD